MAEDTYQSQLDSKISEEVRKELKAIGDDTKKVIEDINKNFESLKKTVDTQDERDAVIKEKLVKLSADVSTRQEELDKKIVKQQEDIEKKMGILELAMKRPGGQLSGEEEKILKKDARDFLLASRSVLNSEEKGVNVEDAEVNVPQYQEYVKAFTRMLRSRGGEKQMTPELYKALSVGIDPDGGYTVSPYLSSRVITQMYEMDVVRQLASVESITTNALEFMVDRGQSGAGWESETSGGVETTTPDFGRKRIPVHIMYAKPRATQQLLEDSGINVEAWIGNKVADRFARLEGASFVTGDGVGKPRGILTYPSGTNWGQIQQVNMGAAATLTADGFIDIKYAMLEYFLERGTWLMARGTVAAGMKIKDGEGNYLWKPSMIAADPSSTILGLPVRMSPSVPAVAANALAVILADWKSAYLIVDRLGITIQRDPFTVKPFVELNEAPLCGNAYSKSGELMETPIMAMAA